MTDSKFVREMFRGLPLALCLACVVMPACIGDDSAERPYADEHVDSAQQSITGSDPCDDPSTATITGTAGDDYLLGTPGVDIIFGLSGNDIIVGKGGEDILCGGPGNDVISGGDDNDYIHGGSGYNWLNGDDGDDTVVGGDDGNEIQGNAGDDNLRGGAGSDTMYGGDGNDSLKGGAGDDYMAGMDGADKLFGNGGDDYIVGGAGDDCLDGGDDDDRLHGDTGNDCLNGGDGKDQLACGDDADSFQNGEWDFSGCETAAACNCGVQTFTAGSCDNYALPADPANPHPDLDQAFNNQNPRRNFDTTGINRYFIHRFEGLPTDVCAATLSAPVKAEGSTLQVNDAMTLTFIQPDQLIPPIGPSRWGRAFGSSTTAPGLFAGAWGTQGPVVVNLDLANLPLLSTQPPSASNLVPSLAANGFLDVYLQDDTNIDCIVLTLTECP